MSLITTLDRIMNWTIANQPDYAASFLPGLSRQEIDTICQAIPGFLSEDIIQLYQWRNGTNEEYWRWMLNFHLHYQPIQETVETCLNIIEFSKYSDGTSILDNSTTFDGQYLFPFLLMEKTYFCTKIFKERRESSQVIDVYAGGGGDAILAFNSLTSMMEMLAEGFETGVLFLNEEDIVIYNEDNNDFRTLFYKYNSSDIECRF